MKKSKNSKGITLITLTITIIILLILSNITIITLSQNNGLLTRAKQAKVTAKNAQENENIILSNYDNQINQNISSSTRNTTKYNITKIGETTGTNELTINATNYDEIYLKIQMNNANGTEYATKFIPTVTLSSTYEQYMILGVWKDLGYWCNVYINLEKCQIAGLHQDGADYSRNGKLEVYGIKYN